MTCNKLLGLVLLAAAVVLGLVLVPSSSMLRYFINDVGQLLVALAVVLIGLERARFFTYRSGLGKALLFISLAALVWGIGKLSLLYHDLIIRVEAPPYPLFSDVLFLATLPLALYGMYMLLKNISISIGVKTAAKLAAIPIVVLLAYFLFQGAVEQGAFLLGGLLSIAFPVGDALILSFALVTLGMIRGSRLSRPIGIMCVSFIMQVVADMGFIYTVSTGTYYVGNWVEMLYIIRFLVLGAGIYYTKDIMGMKMGKRKAGK